MIAQAEGVPNILGQMAGVYNSYTHYDHEEYRGAFAPNTYGDSNSPIASGCVDAYRSRTVFNAAYGENHSGHYYNNVYGKSDHVTPLCLPVCYWKRCQ